MIGVMGIVNVTPDSFSDGGRYYEPQEAVRRARNLIAEGATIVDLGGESTRPGAVPIGWDEEWRRIEPVLAELANDRSTSTRISIDTYHPETARRALALGASIINCVHSDPLPDMLRLLAASRPDTELVAPAAGYGILSASGMMSRIWLDPMIGFDSTREQDVVRLRSIPELAQKGRVIVGASRKRIVHKLTGEKLTGKNLGGSLGIAVWCALHGASAVRVHDVRETVQALKVCDVLNAM